MSRYFYIYVFAISCGWRVDRLVDAISAERQAKTEFEKLQASSVEQKRLAEELQQSLLMANEEFEHKMTRLKQV